MEPGRREHLRAPADAGGGPALRVAVALRALPAGAGGALARDAGAHLRRHPPAGRRAPAPPAPASDAAARRADGPSLNLAVPLSSLPGRDGSADGLLASVRDMTAQREIEAQLHQSERVTALGPMAGGVAHYFNNLLQAILGYAQLMARSPGNTDVIRRGLDVIEKAANSGAEPARARHASQKSQ